MDQNYVVIGNVAIDEDGHAHVIGSENSTDDSASDVVGDAGTGHGSYEYRSGC